MVSQLTFYVVRAFLRRRATFVICLGFALIFECGCTAARPSIKSLWEQVPPVRWSSKSRDPASPASRVEPIDEPAMAANVAVKAEPDSVTDASGVTVTGNNRLKPKLPRLGNRANRSNVRPGEVPMNSDANGSDVNISDMQNSDLVSESEKTDSSMDRLNAALTDDSFQAQALPEHSLTTLEARIRVDALLSQAKQMLDIGQLNQALRTAVLAQEMGENAQLDFSPDEDRPIDFVRRIEGQLEAVQITNQPQSEDDLKNEVTSGLEPDTSDVSMNSAQPSSTTDKDPTRLARIRRDWSTLFRREKKPAATDSTPSTRDSRPAKAVPANDSFIGNEQANRTSDSGARDAIVVANRSVALDNLESSETSAASFVPEVADDLTIGMESMLSENQQLTDAENVDDQTHEDSSIAVITDSKSSSRETDEGVLAQPDFDVAEPVIPSHQVESTTNEASRSPIIDGEDEDRRSNNALLYIVFGICGLLALGCYRRGAT